MVDYLVERSVYRKAGQKVKVLAAQLVEKTDMNLVGVLVELLAALMDVWKVDRLVYVLAEM